ncbi:MAG: molybdopterin molybdenumtransferase MoeA [Rhodobacteraceae bacterium]|nr:molybdopterin molybdenumtransferase MoeA [Paracoccaceae bacterium]
MTGFDAVIVVDWSARSAPSPATPTADAIWIGEAGSRGVTSHYHRTRSAAMAALEARVVEAIGAGERLLVGVDFPLGYPAGFAKALTGKASAFAVWDWLAAEVADGEDNSNNRFEVAARMNGAFPGVGPFWGCPAGTGIDGLPERGTDRSGHGLPERRVVEEAMPRAQPVWKLFTTGSVGSQALLGLPRLTALRQRFGADLAVWPFEAPNAPVVLAEVYPSLIDAVVQEELTRDPAAIKDEVQVRRLAQALLEMGRNGGLTEAFTQVGGAAGEEGWILGAGLEDTLLDATKASERLRPPPLQNDCFALPPGVDWTPVDQALDHLRAGLSRVVAETTKPVTEALGCVLAADHMARRSNPPGPNSAVDGYGFAHAATGEGDQLLPLVEGRAAAGVPYGGAVPEGSAIRILTGALLPVGVDTVVLEEDCAVDGARVAFRGPVKRGSNTRRAGEDVEEGALALPQGHVLRPPDIALLSALGLTEARVYEPLRVGVLSTGDEIAPPGSTMDPARTFDANRPMLLSLAKAWGYCPVDLGHVPDDREALRARLDRGAQEADVILTSGGASAGDEDHVSALLRETGALSEWRIAVKPGRPLALALWEGVPVFGLPGNPVAALVCSLIFARPAFSVLAGSGWVAPQAFTVPAAFEKNKKPGRREYLRARLTPEGAAEVFKSEGSGRISGLSWATGLVEIGDGARHIKPGDPVTFLPYSGFGI